MTIKTNIKQTNIKQRSILQWIIFIIPIVFTGCSLYLKINNKDFDFVENYFFKILPFIFYFLSGLLTFFMIVIFFKQKNKILCIFFILCLGICLCFAGKAFDLNNDLRNLSAFIFSERVLFEGKVNSVDYYSQFIFVLMILISFNCGFSFYLISENKNKICLISFIKSVWYLSSYFSISFLIMILNFFVPAINKCNYSDLAQILFCSGLLFYMIAILSNILQYKLDADKLSLNIILQHFGNTITANALLFCFIFIFLIKPFEIDEDYSTAYNDLGIAYLNIKNYERAEEAYLHAIKLKPDYFSAYFGLGFVYEGQKRLDKSIESLKKAVNIFPGSAEARNKLGFVYAQKGMFKKAIDEFEKILELYPDDINAIKNIAAAKMKLKQQ